MKVMLCHSDLKSLLEETNTIYSYTLSRLESATGSLALHKVILRDVLQQRQMTHCSEMVFMVRKTRCSQDFLARNCQNECMGNAAGKVHKVVHCLRNRYVGNQGSTLPMGMTVKEVKTDDESSQSTLQKNTEWW